MYSLVATLLLINKHSHIQNKLTFTQMKMLLLYEWESEKYFQIVYMKTSI